MPDTPRRWKLQTSNPDIGRGGPPEPRAAGAKSVEQSTFETPRQYKAATSNPDIWGGGPPRARRSEPAQWPTPEEIQRLVTRELESWLRDLQDLWDRWNRRWEKWNLKPVPDDDPFLSSVQSNYPLYAVEVILPRILGENPSMQYQPLDDERDDLAATLLSKVATWQMRRMGFEMSARDFIRQALVTGYSVAKVGWIRQSDVRATTRQETHQLYQDEPGFEFTVDVPSRELVVLRNEPFFEVVNNFDFVWPLTAKTIASAPAVWQRRWITLHELRQQEAAGVYTNVDQITPGDENQWTKAYEPQFSAQGLTVTPPNSNTEGNLDPSSLIEVWERWEDDRLTVIANRRVCIRDEVNPFDHARKPFVDYSPIPRPFQLHGLGLIDTIDDSNEALSTLMRQVNDAITYLIVPMLKGTPGIEWDRLLMQPGGHVEVEDTEAVEPLVLPNVDIAAALQWRQAHIDDMERYSGVFEYGSGNFPQAGSHTATGVSSVIQEGMKRIEEMIKVFSYRTMAPFGYMLERMNAQYLDQSVLIDFSDDPKAQAAWMKFQEDESPRGLFDRFRKRDTTPPASVKVKPEMLRSSGALAPLPQVGQDKSLSETQKRSDAAQFATAAAPIFASAHNPVNMAAFFDWMAKQFSISEEDRKKMGDTPPTQVAAAMAEANGGAPAPSGPGGDNLPAGGVVGAPGAAGGSGPPGLQP